MKHLFEKRNFSNQIFIFVFCYGVVKVSSSTLATFCDVRKETKNSQTSGFTSRNLKFTKLKTFVQD